MQKYLEERDELTFDKIFNQKIGKSQYLINVKGFKMYHQLLQRHIQSESASGTSGSVPTLDSEADAG